MMPNAMALYAKRNYIQWPIVVWMVILLCLLATISTVGGGRRRYFACRDSVINATHSQVFLRPLRTITISTDMTGRLTLATMHIVTFGGLSLFTLSVSLLLCLTLFTLVIPALDHFTLLGLYIRPAIYSLTTLTVVLIAISICCSSIERIERFHLFTARTTLHYSPQKGAPGLPAVCV